MGDVADLRVPLRIEDFPMGVVGGSSRVGA
jgi:hypothetical protein